MSFRTKLIKQEIKWTGFLPIFVQQQIKDLLLLYLSINHDKLLEVRPRPTFRYWDDLIFLKPINPENHKSETRFYPVSNVAIKLYKFGQIEWVFTLKNKLQIGPTGNTEANGITFAFPGPLTNQNIISQN